MVKLLSIPKLIDLGRGYVVNTLPTETHMSFPIPCKTARRLEVAFLYCLCVLRRDSGLHLMAPGHISHLDAETGELSAFRAITPRELGQPHQPLQEIGIYDMYHGVSSAEEFLAARARLYACYDLLLPHAFGARVLLPSEVELARAEFPRLFERVTEEGLLPYYMSAGKAFFGWLR